MIRRPPRSTLDRSSAASDVYKRQDRAPHELKDIEDRLVNRFKWGLSTDLTAPDYETRMAIIIAKMEDRGIKIPEKIIDFICLNIKNNIRAVSYTHLRAHETVLDLVCRLLLEKTK